MKLTVNLKTNHYDLWLGEGNLTQIGGWLSSKWSKRQIVVITDETVGQLYGEKVLESLEAQGFICSMIAVKPGEESKSFENALLLYDFLSQKNLTRSDGIVVLGGGVVGDLGGFVASTYMRGLPFVQVPTTLLAQVDSSIGGKTALNTAFAKNIVGTFAQPAGVLLDISVLKTLQPRQISEGLAEIVKTAAIADPVLWQQLLAIPNKEVFLEKALPIIYACCQIKKNAVEADEFDNGQRLLLNFGHTLGHAIEKIQGYGVVTHGEAVAIGMVNITELAEKKGLTNQGVAQALKEMLIKFDLPTTISLNDSSQLVEAIAHDKKIRGNLLQLILLKEIGTAYIYRANMEDLSTFIEQ